MLPCPNCDGGLCVETETIGSRDVGSGRRLPCRTCRGDNTIPCDACREPATVRDEHGVWCAGCAALNREPRGTGSEPCALCGDAPATSTQDDLPVCNDCRRGSCDACSRNEAVEHRDADAANPEGSFCRTCRASCSRHWCHASECGCPIEICCTLCGAAQATIRAGEPEPPTVCAACAAAEATADTKRCPVVCEERAS